MQEETEVCFTQTNSLLRCCGWRSCLSPADMLEHCCYLLWATSWFGRIWRRATPLFRSKLKTQSFDVQIYRSLFLSLALWLCFPSYSCSPSSCRAAKATHIHLPACFPPQEDGIAVTAHCRAAPPGTSTLRGLNQACTDTDLSYIPDITAYYHQTIYLVSPFNDSAHLSCDCSPLMNREVIVSS